MAIGAGPAEFPSGRGFVAAVVVVAAAILGWQLLVPPVVGLANNGDFEKIMGVVGLRYPQGTTAEEKYFRWATTRLVVSRPWWNGGGYRTSETLLVRAAMLPAKIGGAGMFHIRWLGALHAALFLLFFGSIVRSFLARGSAAAVAAVLAALFFFTDVGYAAPMNAMYGQEASFLGLFGVFAVLASAWREGRFTLLHAAAYFGAAAFFVASKPQETAQAAVLAAFGAWLAASGGRGVRAAGLAGGAALLAFGAWCWSGVPKAMKEASLRKVVFREILPQSPDPRSALADMRLDPVWAGRSPESLAGDRRFRREFAARFGRRRLVLFLATHPARLADLVLPTARAAMVLRPPAFGDLPPRSGYRERQTSAAFGVWSSIRAAAAPAAPALLVVLFGGAAVAAGRVLRDGGASALAAKALLLVVALGTVGFAVCALGSSGIERERHLFAFDAITDALVALAIGAGAGRLAGSPESASRG